MIPWCSKWSGALSDPLSGALSDPLTAWNRAEIIYCTKLGQPWPITRVQFQLYIRWHITQVIGAYIPFYGCFNHCCTPYYDPKTAVPSRCLRSSSLYCSVVSRKCLGAMGHLGVSIFPMHGQTPRTISMATLEVTRRSQGSPTRKIPRFWRCWTSPARSRDVDTWFIEIYLKQGLPSGKHTKNHWKLPFIVDLPIKNGDFP